MDFIYILECQDENFYVGATSNLAQRMKAQFSKNGGCGFTYTNKPLKIVGIYQVKYLRYVYSKLSKCSDIFKKEFYENYITEILHKNCPDKKVSGGRYVRQGSIIPKNDTIYPNCKCNIPASPFEINDRIFLQCSILIDAVYNYPKTTPCDFKLNFGIKLLRKIRDLNKYDAEDLLLEELEQDIIDKFLNNIEKNRNKLIKIQGSENDKH